MRMIERALLAVIILREKQNSSRTYSFYVNCLSECSVQNHMVLNADKTNSILLSEKRSRHYLDNSTLDLQINGTKIKQVTSHKLLGVTLDLDEELSFKEHVEKLCKKLSQFKELVCERRFVRIYK